ncbi:MAG: glycosyltransferase [Endomicrobium sp.]|nr:glycosyltransferase [Endomicrobium sp.]
MPKVSVIIPVYNTEKYLRQCLDSVVNQTLKDIEIICINDGSTDNSLQILNEYANRDSRFVILQQKNAGVAIARNSALRTVRGKYFAFMDADDFYPTNEVLQSLYNTSENEGTLVCGGSLSLCDAKGNYIKNNFQESYFIKNQLMNFIDYQYDYYYQRFIYNFSLLKNNNLYFPDFIRYQDPPWFIKYMAYAEKFYAIKDIVYCYRTGHKPYISEFNFIQAVALAKGLKLSLELTKKYAYETLHAKIVERINNNSHTTLFKNKVQENSDIEYVLKDTLSSLKQDTKFFFNDFWIAYTKYPKVSVIIPVYNTEKYLCHCLDSVVNQTLKDIEIICINDGSTDNSLKILNEYTNKDKRVIVVNQKNSGLSAARNRGLDIVRSPYVFFLDSDDWIEIDTIKNFYDTMLKGNIDIVLCDFVVIPEDTSMMNMSDKFKEYYNKFKKPSGLYKFEGNFFDYRVASCGKLYKMSIINAYKLRFPVNLINEDEAWHWYYFSVIKTIYYHDKSFYHRLIRKSSIMYMRNKNYVGILDILYILKHIYDKYEQQYKKYFYIVVKSLFKRLEYDQRLYKEANRKVKSLSKKLKIDYPILIVNPRYERILKYFFCVYVYNENTHKVINIFGLKIKLRKERLLKFRKNITMFLENILCIKNDGIYKVIGIFRIKIKIKRKHKELLVKLKEQEKSIKNLKDEIKNIVLSQTQDFKKELINKTDSVKKQFSDTLLTHKDEIKNIVLSQTQDFKKELINICKNNEHLNYTQLESLFWLSKRLKIKNSLPPMRNWAMSPDVLLKLHEYITNAKPKTVLEFGSGVSTIVICDALSQNNSGRLISIEHLEKFMEETMEVIKNENLSLFLDLRLAQLKIWTGEHLCNEKPVFWYDEKIVDTLDLKEIDLLIIDGPPGNTNPYARYPALPILYKNLSNKVQVWLDDTNRKDEAEIAHAWAEKYKLIPNFFNLEKGLTILCKT